MYLEQLLTVLAETEKEVVREEFIETKISRLFDVYNLWICFDNFECSS